MKVSFFIDRPVFSAVISIVIVIVGGKDQCVLSGCECAYRVAGGGYSD